MEPLTQKQILKDEYVGDPPIEFIQARKKKPKWICRCMMYHPIIDINPNINGMYIKNVPEMPNLKMMLNKCTYDVQISNNLSKTTLIQIYTNPMDQTVEIEYLFRTDQKSVFAAFSAEYEGKLVYGVIKEKKQATEQYKTNVKQGNTAALVTQDQMCEDIIRINLGNIGSGKQILLKFTIHQELEIYNNKFYKYVIPGSVTPLYCGNKNDTQESDGVSIYSEGRVHKPFLWEININLETNKKLVKTYSPSHKIETTFAKSEGALINSFKGKVSSLVKENNPNATFVLLFATEDIHSPTVVLGNAYDGTQTCAMVTFIPNLSNAVLDDIDRAQIMEGKDNIEDDFPLDLSSVKNEYIFLLDRSGSMSGVRITQAIEALQIFLMSLPPDSYFNIVSFGNNSSNMFTQSVNYEEKNLTKALNEIVNYSANMGGTNIYQPLSYVLAQPRQIGYARNVFLLTDGCISSTNSVIQLCQNYSNANRVHTIGVGSGASRYLIIECAEKGRGQHLFVNDTDDIAGGIIGLLQSAMSPVVDEIQFTYDEQLITQATPNPQRVPFLAKNDPFTMFFFLNKNINEAFQTQVTLQFVDSYLKKPVQFQVEIDSQQDFQNDDITQIAAHRMVKALSDQADGISVGGTDILVVQTRDLNQQIIDLSIAHQVLSKQTAFLCVVKSLTDIQKQEFQDKGIQATQYIVPQLTSPDFSNISRPESASFGRMMQGNPRGAGMILNQSAVNSNVQSAVNSNVQRSSYAAPVRMDVGAPFAIQEKGKIYERRQLQFSPSSESKDILHCEIAGGDDCEQEQNITAAIKKPSSLQKNNNTNTNQRQPSISSLSVSSSSPATGLNFMPVLLKQKIGGFWEYDQKLIIEMKLDQQILTPLLDKWGQIEFGQFSVMTIMILVWLEKKFPDKRSNWTLVHTKALNWIQTLSQEIDISEIRNSIELQIK